MDGEKTALLPKAPASAPARPATPAPPIVNEFAKPDPRSAAGRTKSDSLPPLDFSKNPQIDRFELIREIARGGMGQVFLARDTKLGRKVAIKFLLRNDPTFVQRFLIEARATARCTHENIVTIFEVGEHNGLPYMVLEYLEGKTLSEVLDGKPSLREVTEIMVSVVRALERAHEHGIVHRDLKPSNIFVTDRGQVKVLDFGVARLLDRDESAIERATSQRQASEAAVTNPFAEADRSSVTFGSNSLVGTLPYMSPEQWGAGEVDQLSDIWAIGVIFWRALVGVHPAGTMSPGPLQLRVRDLDTPLPSISSRDISIPPALAATVDRCLAKHKKDRYPSATALLADLQGFLNPRERADHDDECPYPGLAAFGESDSKFFFGRSNEIRTAIAQLQTWPLLAVIGPSGVGKSSFVHAGLVPALRATSTGHSVPVTGSAAEGQCGPIDTWQIRLLRPGRAPLAHLASVLEELVDGGETAAMLVPRLQDAPGLFGTMLRKAAVDRGVKIAVVVDQLEELFTLGDSDDSRQLFLAALLAAADDATSPIRVVLSMRADFLDRLAAHKVFLAELSRGLLFLTAPDRENLRETLERPAELAGYSFESSAIVDDMMQAAVERGALPLLSFAASRLWEARDRQRKLLTTSAYEQMGGIGGAFARHADRVVAALPAHKQPLLRAIVTRMVTPEGTRAVVDCAELMSLAARADVQAILDQLVQARLIHLHTDPDQTATVEIVHEALISEWPTLKRWLDEGHATRSFVHELRAAAKQWAARDKSSDLLWRGATAQDALATARRYVLDLSAIESEFLEAVRREVSRGRRRRVVVLFSIAGVLAAVIAFGAAALVRIQHAEAAAQDEAATAERAQAKVQEQLDSVRAADSARAKAESDKLVAEGAQAQSREDLQKANEDLKQAVVSAREAQTAAESEREKAKAAQTKAEAAQALAEKEKKETQKAVDDAKAARAVAERAKDEAQRRAADLQKQLDKIYNGTLK